LPALKRNHWLLASMLLLSAVAYAQSSQPPAQAQKEALPYRNPRLSVEERVKDLLGRMTLEEKIAQLESTWQNPAFVPNPSDRMVDAKGNLIPEVARRILKNGLGEFTRPGENRGPRQMAEFTNALQKIAVENTRLGIPLLFHEECLHGHAAPGGTSFPVPIALASTWDPALVERIFTGVAREARARGAQQCLMPVVDLVRDPRWGRTEETYGEDPYLVSQMGLAAVRGLQGNGPALDNEHVFATLKHFAVHGQPEGGNNIAPAAYSGERGIRDQWLVPFETAVKQGPVMSVMPSYNEIDGVPSHGNSWLLTRVLRDEWGFKGIVVSDYFAIEQLQSIHHVVPDLASAAERAINSGVDIELPMVQTFGHLADLVHGGKVSEQTIDNAVAHVLRAKFLAGLFENPYVDPARAEQVTNNAEQQQLALESARRAIILLKNDNHTLPLDRARIHRLAVIGPNAADVHLGGYSDNPGRGVSILDGIRKKLGSSVQVGYAQGAAITESPADWNADKVVPPDPAKDAVRIREAVALARNSDAAIVVVGENEQTSREAWSPTHLGDRDSLDLIGRQTELVEAVAATGKPTIVVLIHGRPNSIEKITETVPAILDGWYLGQEGGTAVADVLFGDFNPGGKLPITVPRTVGQLPDFYDYKPSARRGYLFENNTPLFVFGHGLSYTTFRLGNLRIAPESMPADGHATVQVDVTNTGSREGDEVVQLYIRDEVSSVTRPVEELRGFERITLKPGESRTVTFQITPDKLWFHDLQMKRVVEPGDFKIMVGNSSKTSLSGKLTVIGPAIEQ